MAYLIARLQGGLGNQMFQYAAAMQVSKQSGYRFFIDSSYYLDQERIAPNNTVREYRLDAFNISAKNIPKYPAIIAYSLTKKRRINYWLRAVKIPLLHWQLLTENNYMSRAHNLVMYDYWNSEQYFSEVASEIKKEFTLRYPLSSEAIGWERIIQETNSVSIHVRRTDYVNNPITNQYHGVLPLSYYRKGLEIIKQKLNHPEFFVFSDDIAWSKDHLDFLSPVNFVKINGKNQDVEELYLLSQCQHHIIANSTYSWWGAWLSNNPDKMVIAPRVWRPGVDAKTAGIVPDGWLVI